MMKNLILLSSILVYFLSIQINQNHLHAQQEPFTLDQVKSYPFPTGLTAAGSGSRIAWAFNEEGLRNIYVAEGPGFEARRLTNYSRDDGQALSSISISKDGKWVVYIRGGDFGSNWDDAEPVNPTFDPEPPKVQIWSIPFDGGEPKMIGEGESPAISPKDDAVAFVKAKQIWISPIDGSEEAEKAFHARGSNGSPKWSPDGSRLAFVSSRQGHAFIGVFQGKDNPVLWMDPAFSRDGSPRWSPDGNQIAFVRRPGSGGVPKPILKQSHSPWEVRIADLDTRKSMRLWKAPETLRGSVPTTHGRTNLHWGAGRIVFLSYHDGWPHLYSISPRGGESQLLTPGSFMAEYIKMSSDGKFMVFCGNTGREDLDIDRRHIVKVSVQGGDIEVMTPGIGNEWTPVITGDGSSLVYLSATPQRPPLPAVMDLRTGDTKILAEERIPRDYPDEQLVKPKQIVFHAPDGTPIHSTLFDTDNGTVKKPAVIYIHGGPPRQMLLGWHYSSYYSNAYATNQYLASKGFAVLSVNYRLGIGYGYEFHRPPNCGWRGAGEYQDIKAAGEWLKEQDFVIPDKIGVYGGSYGGYLTAMALGKDSDLFAAGVDIHGVHDRTVNRMDNFLYPNQYEKAPDAEYAARVAWESSPTAYVGTWTSPVMIIHADDDRNVAFSQSTDLVQRLESNGVPMETFVIVDDTHHFMMHKNQVDVNKAVADFLIRNLQNRKRPAEGGR